MRRNRAFYSKWSRWSPCTDLCLTTRAKSCKYAAVCGKVQVNNFVALHHKTPDKLYILIVNQVTEEAYCYTSGSQCEAWYKAGRSLEVGAGNGLQQASVKKPSKDIRSQSVINAVDRDQVSKRDKIKRFRDYKPECGRRGIHGRTPGGGQSHAADIAFALRIIGGTEARPGRWPWMVVILNKYRYTMT